MKNIQKNTLKRILDAEQLTISALADIVEVNRGTLSKLLNHNTQLTENNWNKISEAYPEHNEQPKLIDKKSAAKAILELNKKNKGKITIEDIKNISPKKSELTPVLCFGEAKTYSSKETTAIERKILAPMSGKENIEIIDTTIPPQFKTKESERHRNLNCPESSYHMKVKNKDLLRGRPLCPLTQLPMMVKEELKIYKKLGIDGKKKFIEELTHGSIINLIQK